MEPRLIDAHCHLDLMTYPNAVADETAAKGLGSLIAGSTHATSRQQKRGSRYPNIIAGVGLHPGGSPKAAAVYRSRCALRSCCPRTLHRRSRTRLSARFAESEPLQIQAFDRLCDTLVQRSLAGRVISIHAVRSAGTVLDILESHGLLIPNPDFPVIIFHWFSGTSDELARARNAGCYFP